MADLSPAAQAVHDAFWSHPNGKPLAQDCPDTDQLVAALRAAAECSCEEQDEPPAGPYEQGYLDAIEWIFKRLNTIAAELEGANER